MKTLLETQNLQLCWYEQGDTTLLASILTDPVTMRFWPQPFTSEKVQDWIGKAILCYEQHGIGRLGIIEKNSRKLVGDCGIIPLVVAGEQCWDLGIIIYYPFENTGYAAEALRAVVQYCFEILKFLAIRVNTAMDNKVVRFYAEKFGMKLLKTFINPRNRNLETALYELTSEQWFSEQKKRAH